MNFIDPQITSPHFDLFAQVYPPHKKSQTSKPNLPSPHIFLGPFPDGLRLAMFLCHFLDHEALLSIAYLTPQMVKVMEFQRL